MLKKSFWKKYVVFIVAFLVIIGTFIFISLQHQSKAFDLSQSTTLSPSLDALAASDRYTIAGLNTRDGFGVYSTGDGINWTSYTNIPGSGNNSSHLSALAVSSSQQYIAVNTRTQSFIYAGPVNRSDQWVGDFSYSHYFDPATKISALAAGSSYILAGLNTSSGFILYYRDQNGWKKLANSPILGSQKGALITALAIDIKDGLTAYLGAKDSAGIMHFYRSYNPASQEWSEDMSIPSYGSSAFTLQAISASGGFVTIGVNTPTGYVLYQSQNASPWQTFTTTYGLATPESSDKNVTLSSLANSGNYTILGVNSSLTSYQIFNTNTGHSWFNYSPIPLLQTNLWPANSPHLHGANPQDIPTLTVYPASSKGEQKPAILFITGGGYEKLDTSFTSEVTKWLNGQGITAVVLKYRVAPNYHYPDITDDGIRAMQLIRYNAANWNINSNKVGVYGLSAGGHLAAYLSTRPNSAGDPTASDPVERMSSKPNLEILEYPVTDIISPSPTHNNFLSPGITKEKLSTLDPNTLVNASTPPTFITCGSADKDVPCPTNGQTFASNLSTVHVSNQILIIPNAKHGYHMKDVPSWPIEAAKWMKGQGFY